MNEEKLRAALKPFADCFTQICPTEDDAEWAKFRLTIGDYRRAWQAMSAPVGPTFESIHNMALEQAAQAAMRVARRYRDEIMSGRLQAPGSNPPPPAGDKPKPPSNPPKGAIFVEGHDLYKTSDADAPDEIRDRNGAVALDLCKRCNRGESELSEPCTPPLTPFQLSNEALLQEVEKWMHYGCGADPNHIIEMARRFKTLIQEPAPHPDDTAVESFAAAMKVKLAKKRAEGRGGWDTEACSRSTLSAMLIDHVAKGDPVDVANLAMMLHQRGEWIEKTDGSSSPEPDLAGLVNEFFEALDEAQRLERTTGQWTHKKVGSRQEIHAAWGRVFHLRAILRDAAGANQAAKKETPPKTLGDVLDELVNAGFEKEVREVRQKIREAQGDFFKTIFAGKPDSEGKENV